jgi:hypothetical protein
MEMKTFAGASLVEAEKAAADWWSRQGGLARLTKLAAPINTGRRTGSNRWKVTVVFVRTGLPETEFDRADPASWRSGTGVARPACEVEGDHPRTHSLQFLIVHFPKARGLKTKSVQGLNSPKVNARCMHSDVGPSPSTHDGSSRSPQGPSRGPPCRRLRATS